MAKRSRSRQAFVSPIDPRMHFVLFLIMALVLVVVVGFVMQKTSSQSRAFLMCGKSSISAAEIAEKRRTCPPPYKLNYTTDNNGCPAVECVQVVE